MLASARQLLKPGYILAAAKGVNAKAEANTEAITGVGTTAADNLATVAGVGTTAAGTWLHPCSSPGLSTTKLGPTQEAIAGAGTTAANNLAAAITGDRRAY
jgi:hypothetical protein